MTIPHVPLASTEPRMSLLAMQEEERERALLVRDVSAIGLALALLAALAIGCAPALPYHHAAAGANGASAACR